MLSRVCAGRVAGDGSAAVRHYVVPHAARCAARCMSVGRRVRRRRRVVLLRLSVSRRVRRRRLLSTTLFSATSTS